MEQLGIGEFTKAVIGIGNNLEASVLTAFVLRKLGVEDVWAKAITTSQSEILAQVGVSHVVRPEHEMGQRVAHLVRGRMRDYIEFDDGYAIARTVPPRSIIGRTLADAAVRDRFGVTVIGIKSPGRDVSHPKPTSVVNEGDLVVATSQHTHPESSPMAAPPTTSTGQCAPMYRRLSATSRAVATPTTRCGQVSQGHRPATS